MKPFDRRSFTLGLEIAEEPLWHLYSPNLYDVMVSNAGYKLFLLHAPQHERSNHDAFRVITLEPRHTQKRFVVDHEVLRTLMQLKGN